MKKKLNVISKLVASSIIMSVIMSMLLTSTVFAASDNETLPSGINTSDIGNEIDEFYEEHRDTAAGMMVAVFDSEEVFFEGYYGEQNEEGLPVNSDTVMEWGSTSKLLVWVSVMQLHEQGLIDFDTDIREYLPAGFFTRLRYDDRITMINLMNHDAGFQESMIEMETSDPDNVLSLEEYLRAAEPYQIFRPGEVVAYSNWSTTLAAFIVERVSGTSYVDYVHANIFEPLGMNLSALDPYLNDNEEVQRRWENLNYYNADGFFMTDEKWHINCYPCGMCTSTLTDMMTFCRALMTRDTRLMSNESFEEFLTPTRYYSNNDIRNAHGMWAIEYGVTTLGHGGNTRGCSSYLLFSEDGTGFVVMTNQAGEQIFNSQMPELVFGSYEGTALLSNVQSNDVMYSSRTVFEGPLKILKILNVVPLTSVKKMEFAYTYFAVENGEIIEAGCSDLVKADKSPLCAELMVIVLYVITVLCSAIMFLKNFVRLIIRKPGKNPLFKWNILTSAINVLSVAPMFVLIVSLSAMKNIGFYKALCGSYILFMIMWIALICFRFKVGDKNATKGAKFVNIMTIVGIVSCFAFTVVEQLFMFWRL